MNAVELFAGAGGLALGVARAGFEHLAVIELDASACETIRANQTKANSLAADWNLHEGDVREFNYSTIKKPVDLLCAGAPCQPFSVGGKGRAFQDERDMFSEVVRAIRELRPKALLVENVRGLSRSKFKRYFDYLLLAIASPDLARTAKQTWEQHLASLQKRTPQDAHDSLRYDVNVKLVNAADYGVPQSRERLFIVAFRSDLNVKWVEPKPTHSLDALLWSQWHTSKYWKRHGLSRKRPGHLSRRSLTRWSALKGSKKAPSSLLPWVTVRDTITDLPRLRRSPQVEEMDNHFLNVGARSYGGHSGSLLDDVAKTLKAGANGVPGGENSLYQGAGRIRYFSVRECARLQTFPDEFIFSGAWTRQMRQVGNAVPVRLAEVMARSIHKALSAIKADQRGKVFQFPGASARRRAS